jgi:hypothetical protein
MKTLCKRASRISLPVRSTLIWNISYILMQESFFQILTGPDTVEYCDREKKNPEQCFIKECRSRADRSVLNHSANWLTTRV